MEAIFLPGRVDRESEFQGGLTGACGPNAAAMAERWADQSHLGTLDVFHRMRATGQCDPNGAATLAALANDARAAGYRVDVLAYQEPMPEASWRTFFERHVGRQAIVFETANGQALRDAFSGKGENAVNLHYHFVLVAGWHPGGYAARAGRDLPPGWWCADGDNFAAGNTLQFYPDVVLGAARPCAAMAVWARVPMPVTGSGGGSEMGVPAGWQDDGKTLRAPNGHVVTLGFRDFVLGHAWAPENVPLENERHVATLEWHAAQPEAGQRQVFLRSALAWDQAHGVRELDLGAELLAVEARLARQPAADSPATTAILALAAALKEVGN